MKVSARKSPKSAAPAKPAQQMLPARTKAAKRKSTRHTAPAESEQQKPSPRSRVGKGKQSRSAAPAKHAKPTQQELTAKKKAGKKKSEATAKRLLDMLEVVKLEIESNDGVYPYGRLSQRGVAKRAGVDKSTLHTTNGKAAGGVVRDFVNNYNAPKEDESKPSKRRTVQQRLQDKNLEYETLLQQHQIRNLHLQQMKAERDQARALAGDLQVRVNELESLLGAANGDAKPAKAASVTSKSTPASAGSKAARNKVLPFTPKRS